MVRGVWIVRGIGCPGRATGAGQGREDEQEDGVVRPVSLGTIRLDLTSKSEDGYGSR
jgi:hypothetical protein